MTLRDAPPFSYRVNVGHVSLNPITVRMEADEAERKALARGWGVSAVERFSTELELNRWKRDGLRVAGTVRATIVQPCVVTLEPVTQVIEETLQAIFVPEGSKLARIGLDGEGQMIVDAEGPDAPETFSGDAIDVGMVAAEFAALAIDPFPRKPGVVFETHLEDDADQSAEPSPFAALRDWKPSRH
jgi:hypothetical protein